MYTNILWVLKARNIDDRYRYDALYEFVCNTVDLATMLACVAGDRR